MAEEPRHAFPGAGQSARGKSCELLVSPCRGYNQCVVFEGDL